MRIEFVCVLYTHGSRERTRLETEKKKLYHSTMKHAIYTYMSYGGRNQCRHCPISLCLICIIMNFKTQRNKALVYVSDLLNKFECYKMNISVSFVRQNALTEFISSKLSLSLFQRKLNFMNLLSYSLVVGPWFRLLNRRLSCNIDFFLHVRFYMEYVFFSLSNHSYMYSEPFTVECVQHVI